jgi:cytochrome c oxidase cbb3-type subunit 1
VQEQTTYNYRVVRQFSIMTVVWGVVGMLVGVIIAAQLMWPDLTYGVPWLAYGRLRPLHTNAVIFAFGGCALFATSYYVVQRTCHARLFSDKLAAFTFWGWQAVIVLAAITLPLGITTSKEYAELEWPIDVLITLVWVSYAVVLFRHIVQAPRKAHIRCELVLWRVYPHRCHPAPGQQCRDSGQLLEILFGLCRGAGRDGPMVVRA